MANDVTQGVRLKKKITGRCDSSLAPPHTLSSRCTQWGPSERGHFLRSPAGLFSERSHVRWRHHGREHGRDKKKKKKEREGQHKGFSRQTNGGLDCSDTATGHTLPVAHTHFYTQAPLGQMTASELGGTALASLSLCFLFLPAQPGPKTRTHTTTHPEPEVAPGLNQAGLVCPPNTLLHTR